MRVRTLFTKTPEEKIHGEHFANIFLKLPNYDEAAKLANEKSAHEIDFGIAYIVNLIAKLDRDINTKRNRIIANAILYAQESLQPVSMQALIEQVYNAKLCAELAMIEFTSVHKGDFQQKKECITMCVNLDKLYRERTDLSNALHAIQRYKSEFAEGKFKQMVEPAPVITASAEKPSLDL